MQLTPSLQQQLAQAARMSMRIEGYTAQATPPQQALVQKLMEQARVQVQVPRQ